jgi:hypothetical protein
LPVVPLLSFFCGVQQGYTHTPYHA